MKRNNTLLQYKFSLSLLSENYITIAVIDEDEAEVFRQYLSEIYKPHVFNPDYTTEVTLCLDTSMIFIFWEKVFLQIKLNLLYKSTHLKNPLFRLVLKSL